MERGAEAGTAIELAIVKLRNHAEEYDEMGQATLALVERRIADEALAEYQGMKARLAARDGSNR